MLLPPKYMPLSLTCRLWWAAILALSLWKEGGMTHNYHKMKTKQQLKRSPAILGFEGWETFFPWVRVERTLWNVGNHVPDNIHAVNSIVLLVGWFLIKMFHVGQWYNDRAQFRKKQLNMGQNDIYQARKCHTSRIDILIVSNQGSSVVVWRDSERLHQEGDVQLDLE